MDSKTWTNAPRVVIFFLLMAIATSANAQTNFEKLRAKFDAGEVFEAEFQHTYIDSYTEESTTSMGSVWINAVGYKLESDAQTIVVDGTLSTVYDATRNRVIVSEYEAEEDDFAPSRMLSDLDETYTASEQVMENGHTLITLKTDDDFAAFYQVEIEIDARQKPLKITAYDIADNIIITTFNEGRFIADDGSIFELSYPEDAEIIDMRYQRMNKYLKVIVSLAVAGLFLWLAFKNVEFSDILDAAKGMSWGWVAPFAAVTLGSHFVRALRWRMLFEDKQNLPHRSTLYTGVMFGYLTNIAFPRLGEVTRPVYVARQIGESNSKLIGTVVLERVVDVLSMFIIMALVGVFLISDVEVLSNLFGVDLTNPDVYTSLLKFASIYGGGALLFVVILFFVVRKLSAGNNKLNAFFDKVRITAGNFWQGILSIRQLENWPLFIFYTTLIWATYITMTYIPFYMFNMTNVYDLTYADALILTMVSAVGISIPTPGGIGSYHLLVTFVLNVLYSVPEVTGLAFATISHAATLVVIVIASPTLLAVEKYLALKREAGKG